MPKINLQNQSRRKSFYEKNPQVPFRAPTETNIKMNLKLIKSPTHSPEIQPFKIMGYPINQQEISKLKFIVFGSVERQIPNSWKNKGFEINKYCSFGFMQKKGGPCTVLASINAYLFKHLLFSEFESFNCVSIINNCPKLTPTEDQVYNAFAYALTNILYKCAVDTKLVKLAMYNPNPIQIAKVDGITERMEIYEFKTTSTLIEMTELVEFILLNIHCFKGNTVKLNSHALLAVLYSCVLTRGLDLLQQDLQGNGPLIDNIVEFEYGTQSVVNLMLTGRAVMDTLDFKEASQLGLQGIQQQSDIGFLTPIDKMVGQCLQCPRYPIWILLNESHYTVMFKINNGDIYTYYDMLGLKSSCWEFTLTNGKELTLKDALGNEDLNQDTVQLCCLSKWPNVRIQWIE